MTVIFTDSDVQVSTLLSIGKGGKGYVISEHKLDVNISRMDADSTHGIFVAKNNKGRKGSVNSFVLSPDP